MFKGFPFDFYDEAMNIGWFIELFANKFFVIVKLYLMSVSSTSISSDFIDSLDSI